MRINEASKKWLGVVGALVLMLSAAACSQIVPSISRPANLEPTDNSAAQLPSAATPVVPALAGPTRVPTGVKTATVTRGSIAEILSLDGTVTAQNEQPVSYNGRGNVTDVKVKVGDSVTQGDELLELEAPHHVWAQDVEHELEQAQAKVDADKNNLAKAQAAIASQQQQAAANAAAAAQQQQQAISDASTQLKRAQDNLARVQSGASATDRQSTQNSVTAAQNTLAQAQAAYNAVAAGPDPNAVKTAARDVTNAQAALTKAQSDLNALTKGPDPGAVRQAQALLDRNQTQLQIVQATKPDPKVDPTVAKLQHDQAVQDAQLAVDKASAALVQLKQPPLDSDVQAAQQRVSDASDAIDAAQAKLAQVQSGPDPTALDAAQAVIDKSKQDLLAAQSKQAEINSHPTPAELGDAQDQVRKAQAALDQARNAPAAAPQDNGVDLSQLQSAINEDQATVDGLQQTLDATKLLAPTDGVIVAVRVKAGQSITSEKPVFIIAPSAPPILRADLEDDQVQRLSVGQSAKVSLDPGNAAAAMFDATVTKIVPASVDGSTAASAELQVQWPDGGSVPKFGAPAEADMTLQQKDNVLLVPAGAVHQSAGKATVQVQSGTLRRLVNVQVGIKNDTSAEIVSGLTEGQVVILGTS